MAHVELKVPDIGDFKEVEVIEVLVSPGDVLSVEQSLITVESDKASMEIPSSHAGSLVSLSVKVGDKVSEGSVLGVIDAEAAGGAKEMGAEGVKSPTEGAVSAAPLASSASSETPSSAEKSASSEAISASAVTSLGARAVGVMPASTSIGPSGEKITPSAPTLAAASASSALGTNTIPTNLPHASPSVRKFARELGVDLNQVKGSGPKGRITQLDVQGYVKSVMSGAAAGPSGQAASSGSGVGLDLLPWPQVDFAKFGPIDPKPLSRIKKISGANLHRNWVMIPHVTNNDEADITDLEALRVQLNKENEKSGIKLTMLAFLMKAVVAALKKFPEFNASIDGETLVLKKYFHIGFAADTPNGLVVPVVRDVDQKGVMDLANETSEMAKRAREGKLSPSEMQGGCFSISSLGGIGGTHFTPIINAPEVAILGVSKSAMKPVWNGKEFVPRLTLPLSLSYDHRVIDGAAAARFNAYLGQLLSDFRRIAL
jgi:pyruvate dehydrogenase E2 component (dihydrolipoamide acetyltransferase)